MKKYVTEQEEFWAGDFGNDYVDRNKSNELTAGSIALFNNVLKNTIGINSVIEFGANIGINIKAFRQLLPNAELSAIEINEKAVEELNKIEKVKTYYKSIFDFETDYKRDFVFTRGVLIHLNPSMISNVYDLMYNTSKKYICIAEYYNPSPVEIQYRGNSGKLFKRDFAGEIMDKYPDLKLVDYGFVYHRDNNFPQDDITWFLLEKQL